MSAGARSDDDVQPGVPFTGNPADSGTGALRVIHDLPATGPVNMARDEALLALIGRGAIGLTLRLYEWSEPTISLGYFQRYADYQALPPPAGGLPVVRRLTGGGAILHDRELTYSLVLPIHHPSIAGRPTRLYEIVHEALIRCLSAAGVMSTISGLDDGSSPTRGPFFCFARRHPLDVVIRDAKLAGSAQRRTREAVLQHGSIIVARRFDQQPAATLIRSGIDTHHLRKTLPQAIASALGAQWSITERSNDELALADELSAKYADAAWTLRR
ncbi:MAG: lipoate--protein ligase family protein [Phycisphaerales bacterium]|nr:lipoate--protein ligase family protein [Phycisphaerales bacterium]